MEKYTIENNTMGVVEVRVSILKSDYVDGNVSVSFKNGICIRQIKVIVKEDGAIVKYPSYESKQDQKRKNYVFAINKDLQAQLDEIIISEYYKEKKKRK